MKCPLPFALVSLAVLCSLLPAQGVLKTHNGHQYMVSTVAMSRSEAASYAQSLGGYLACINTAAENLWLTQTFLTTPPVASGVQASALWIGLSDATTEGTWLWDSGEPFTWTNWAPTQPNNDVIGQDFAVMWTMLPNSNGNTWDDTGAPLTPGLPARALVEIPLGPAAPPPAGNATQIWNGHTYDFSSTSVTFAEARAAAMQAGGQLVSINSAAENIWVAQQFGTSTQYWIGFTDEVLEGTWAWDSGEPVTFTNWSPGEPDNLAGGQDHGLINLLGSNGNGPYWSDHGAPSNPGFVARYVIEMPSIAPPAPAMPLAIHNGHQYMLSQALLTWNEAQAAATAAGGYLVSVNSAAENRFLSTVMLPGAATTAVWMGFSDAVAEGAWVWESGEPQGFTNWAPGQPDNAGNGQDFGAFRFGNSNADGWTWADEGGPANTLFRANALIEIPHLNPPTVDYPATWNGHQYFMSSGNMLFSQAETLARAMGGYLACPNTGEENLWISSYFNSVIGASGALVWLGGNDASVEGTWSWDSGEPWSFTSWSAGQPSATGDRLCYWSGSGSNAWGRMWGATGPPDTPMQMARALIEIPCAAGLTLACEPRVQLGTPARFSIRPNPGAPVQGNRPYLFDIGLSGNVPGLPVPGMGVVPLNAPFLGALYAAQLPAIFQSFVGFTNANGEAQPSFNYSFQPSLVGLRFDAAAVSFAPTANGLGALSNGASFVYVAPQAQPTSNSPANGTTAGGTTVVIAGTRFMPGISVNFDGVPATNVVVSSNGFMVVCTTPPHIVGTVIVTLQNPLTNAAMVPGGYTYTPTGPGPFIASLTPNTSPVTGGGTINISGNGFTPTCVVRMNGAPIASTFVSGTALSFVAPPQGLGPAFITVINPEGQISPTVILTYIPGLSLTAIAHVSPPAGATVTLTGTGFQQGMSVNAGGVTTTATVQAQSSASFFMPSGAACNSTLTVTNPSGQSASLPFNPGSFNTIVENFSTTINRFSTTGSIQWNGGPGAGLVATYPQNVVGSGAFGAMTFNAGNHTLDTGLPNSTGFSQGVWDTTAVTVNVGAVVRIIGTGTGNATTSPPGWVQGTFPVTITRGPLANKYPAHIVCQGAVVINGQLNGSAGTNAAYNFAYGAAEQGARSGSFNNGAGTISNIVAGGTGGPGGGEGGRASQSEAVRTVRGERGYGPPIAGAENIGPYGSNPLYGGGEGGMGNHRWPAFPAVQGDLGGLGGAGGSAFEAGTLGGPFTAATAGCLPFSPTSPLPGYVAAQPTGQPAGFAIPISIQGAGSGGGGGGDRFDVQTPPSGDDQGGGGGGGGGGLRINAVGDITVGPTASIAMNGANGFYGSSFWGGAGGGGSGGQIWLQSFSNVLISASANMTVNYGNLPSTCGDQGSGRGGLGLYQFEDPDGIISTNFIGGSPSNGNIVTMPFTYNTTISGAAISNFFDLGTSTPDITNITTTFALGNAPGALVNITFQGAHAAVSGGPDPATITAPVLASNFNQLDGYRYVRFSVDMSYSSQALFLPGLPTLPSVSSISITTNCP